MKYVCGRGNREAGRRKATFLCILDNERLVLVLLKPVTLGRVAWQKLRAFVFWS